MRQCIYCSTDKTLNTQITITLDDGSKQTVDICDEHAEDATIKSARQAYVDRQQRIQEVIDQAKALGLDISQSESGLSVAEGPKPESDAQASAPSQPQAPDTTTPQRPPDPPKNHNTPADEEEEGYIPTERVDKRRPIVSKGGQVGGANVDSHTSYDVSEARASLPEESLRGKVKMTMVEGREGQPLAVPQRRIDGTGTTQINISKSEDDNKLQRRFKKMAQSSMDGEAPDFARSGYTNSTVSCPVCRGDGEVKMGKKTKTCPKCGGGGVISTY